MNYKGLRDFVNILEKNDEIIRINEFVDPIFEITEITDRFSKEKNGGKALFFENTGKEFPVLINALGSLKRMSLALSVNNLNEILNDIDNLFSKITSKTNTLFDKLKLLPNLAEVASYMPKVKSGKGECQQVVIKEPDLNIFPILKCWPFDGGNFITLPLVHSKSPETGNRNVGMYRMQVFDKNLTGMHWHRHKTGANHFEMYKKLGKKMPLAVALGGDPTYTYSATAPLPENIDEYILAGFLRKKRVNLVKCITQNLEVPSDADIIIEGYVDPTEDFIWEGPFGDHTGFYSLADWYPKFHVTCITHRKNAVYPATIVGIPPMEDAYIAKATEKVFFTPIRFAILPEMKAMNIPDEGVAHNITLINIEKSYPGQALKAANALWGAGQMMFNKIMIVTSNNIKLDNYYEQAKFISENCNPATDIIFSRGPLDVLDHSSNKFSYGSKICIDGTIKLKEEIEDNNICNNEFSNFDKEAIITNYKDIIDINDNLLNYGIAAVIMTVKKNKVKQIINISKEIFNLDELMNIKFLFIVDSFVDIFDVSTVAWIIGSNIDPERDCYIISSEKSKRSHLLIDATIKTLDLDNFRRDWPNVVVSSKEIIDKIDKNWEKYKIGEFIKSPSAKYKSMEFGKNAVLNRNS